MPYQRRPTTLLLLGLVLILTITATSCQKPPPPPLSLTIDVHEDEPDVGLWDTAAYQVTGIDAEIARYIATHLHATIHFQPTQSQDRDSDLLHPAPRRLHADLVLASYSIDAERRQKGILFAGPYFNAHQAILTLLGNHTITDLATLAKAKVCTAANSTSYERLHRLVPHLKAANSSLTCVANLTKPATDPDSADAVSTDDAVLWGYLSQNPTLKVLPIPIPGLTGQPETEHWGVGLPPGQQDRCNQITRILQQMINNGQWLQAVKNNFGWLQSRDYPTGSRQAWLSFSTTPTLESC